MSMLATVRAFQRPRAGTTRRADGFTLIELLVTLAIIGVLSSIAFPNFENFMYRTKRGEAYLGLRGVHIAQTTFYAEVGRYGGSFDEIGYEVLGGTRVDANTIDGPFYRFEMAAYPYLGAPSGNFWATATGDLMGEDPILDILLLESHVIVAE